MSMIKDTRGKIYGPEELNKIGELLPGIPADEIIPSTNNKPTVKIKTASIINKNERADKLLRVLTGNI
jgi:hypothetical protein